MFEITGAQIADLNDADLRTLVARLALAELRAQGCPSSSVTAGGNQDAADGGLDVRVECPSGLPKPDFVPRQHTGFQVKKPNMPVSAIRNEMRPGGVLRPVIAELAARSGAYIIVSAQKSVADRPLRDRRDAILEQLGDRPEARQLHSDFYDRDRLANWVNHYPGIVAWVRTRLGIGMSGWSSIGDWCGVGVSEETPYHFNNKTCLTDERAGKREQLTIGEGVARLRVSLSEARQCIRLIGLSGLGKTRLVQALFEDGVGEVPLDPGLAVYTDYSVETDPTARDMAQQLVIARKRAILIVDNCNPATHSELARICSSAGSQVSLLTVEYDVRDDVPERTEVFRLQSASPEMVELWLEKIFPNVTQVDRRTISEFSDGNFRVAGALADTLGKGETLGELKSSDLFERIFCQRNAPDRDLLLAAEDLALLYSIDGQDTSESGELARVAAIRNVAVATMYAALDTLRKRGIVQLRGRWRAILPHAIANPLARLALERMPPDDFDRFCGSLTPRMQKSLSRRLGYLHESAEARAAVERLLRADGPMGELVGSDEDGLQIISNIAPVTPDAVLARIERDMAGPRGVEILDPQSSNRWKWIRLIKLLAYDPPLFDHAATLLARFLAAEPPNHNSNSASDKFAELFHRDLSGTKALPDQRRALVRRFAESGNPAFVRCASVALNALLEVHLFSSSSDFEFGARSRDYGWCPQTCGDITAWYNGAIDLAVELSPIIGYARDHLARRVRELWRFGGCHDALDRAATYFSAKQPWIDGWIGFRRALRVEGNAMPDEVRARLVALIERLRPTDLLHQARAVVLGRRGFGSDVAYGDADDGDVMKPHEAASRLARKIGAGLAHDPETRAAFIAELLIEHYPKHACECGIGLSDGAAELDVMWQELLGQFSAADADRRNAKVLGGFIHGAHAKDSAFANAALDDAIQNPDLAASLPYLQSQVAVDAQGIARLRRAVERGVLSARDFHSIANGCVEESPPEALGPLLTDIGNLADGVEIALEILHMHFNGDQEAGHQRAPTLIAVGRELLLRADFRRMHLSHDFEPHSVIRVCCAGPDGAATLRKICARIRAGLETDYFSPYRLSYVLEALFETHPLIALDEFLLPEFRPRNRVLFDGDFGSGTPVEDVGSETLVQWANIDPDRRYPLLGKSIPMFKRQQGEDENGVSTLFLEILGHAPDKRAFLGDISSRWHRGSWSGSLADILEQRCVAIAALGNKFGGEVLQWVTDMLAELKRRIEHESKRDREGEQSFE
jgi:hypothetical protein